MATSGTSIAGIGLWALSVASGGALVVACTGDSPASARASACPEAVRSEVMLASVPAPITARAGSSSSGGVIARYSPADADSAA